MQSTTRYHQAQRAGSITQKLIMANLAVMGGIFVMSLLWRVFDFGDSLDLSYYVFNWGNKIERGIFYVGSVFFLIWAYRAHRNLKEMGILGLEFVPGWAVGWYFIPLANCFMPPRVMTELWKASSSEQLSDGSRVDWKKIEAPSSILTWWLLFIIPNIYDRFAQYLVSFFFDNGFYEWPMAVFFYIPSIMLFISGLTLHKIIGSVNEMQHEKLIEYDLQGDGTGTGQEFF